MPVEAVLATRSQDGLSLVEGSGRVTHLRSEAKEVFDVTGAGDTVIAVMGAALASGVPLVQCAEIANLAAGIVVGKAGTAVIYANDLIRAVRQQEFSTAESKILDQVAAAEQVEMWRRRGYSIGLMNGFFELLHPAHVRLLSQASKMCDRLIVGINGDDSILRIKGEHPILHEAARSAIIASLEDVDMVVIFQEDTPAQLIELLKPDLLIKRTVPSDAGTIEKMRPTATDRFCLSMSRKSGREPSPAGCSDTRRYCNLSSDMTVIPFPVSPLTALTYRRRCQNLVLPSPFPRRRPRAQIISVGHPFLEIPEEWLSASGPVPAAVGDSFRTVLVLRQDTTD